jgi:DNA-directed RNA polymerase subunit N (RpoN/RPB10)
MASDDSADDFGDEEGVDPFHDSWKDGSHYDPLDPQQDCMRPPSVPTQVWCLHCGKNYSSALMEYRIITDDGDLHGFWCCPIEGCGGAGFCFDIFPMDPNAEDPDFPVDRNYVDPDGRDIGHWVDDPPADPATDDWRPPTTPTPVRCEKCGRRFSSTQMRWVSTEEAGELAGWYCIDPKCFGMGFGEDVRPTDPVYVDEWNRKFYRPGELSRWDAFDKDAFDDSDIPF